ncbi:MAG: GGDEF domain-containing protein, partial [Methylomonas sp.]|nr:GGDEF domain-containing protein [Methylomonas sp.]
DTLVLCLLDLDRFKEINDTHGHDAGDRVLIEVAERFQSCVRASDVVARLGGDEFLIGLVNCASLDHIRQIAGDIVTSIGRPIQLGPELGVEVGVSIGICVEQDSGQTLEAMYKAADRAMYEVKRQGRNGFAMVLADGTIAVEKIVGNEQ